MKRFVAVAVVTVFVACTAALAQHAAPRDTDAFSRFLFPPELVMGHQSEIGLDDEQRDAIKDAVKEAESTFLDLKWEIHAEAEKLAGLLEPPRVDLAGVLAQSEIVMGLEKEVKKTHIALLVRIKNTLSETQQRQLREIRQRMIPAPPAPPRHPDPSAMPGRPVPPASPAPVTPG